MMEIWGLIGEDHHRLKLSLEALHDHLERGSERSEELRRQFEREFTAHADAEESAVYPILRTLGAFEQPVARAIEHDRKLRLLLKELGRTPPQSRLVALREIKAALAEHIERASHMLPVAHRELRYHVAEHMKHEFESAKDAALKRLKGAYGEPATRPNAAAETMLIASGFSEPGERDARGRGVMNLVERVLRREAGDTFVCQAAIDRVEDPYHRSLLGEIAEDHLRHAREIADILSAADGRTPPARDAGRFGGWAKIVSAAFFIGDKAILRAVRSNEEQSRVAYERVLRKSRPAAPLRGLLERLAEDARRHARRISSVVH